MFSCAIATSFSTCLWLIVTGEKKDRRSASLCFDKFTIEKVIWRKQQTMQQHNNNIKSCFSKHVGAWKVRAYWWNYTKHQKQQNKAPKLKQRESKEKDIQAMKQNGLCICELEGASCFERTFFCRYMHVNMVMKQLECCGINNNSNLKKKRWW